MRHRLVSFSLLGAALALGVVARPTGAQFVLEVPAAYVSVGQEFVPRLANRAGAASITLELRDSAGRSLTKLSVEAGAPLPAFSLPRAGSYSLRASPDDSADDSSATQTVNLVAVPEPAAFYGGVRPLAALGLDAGATEYLRAHGFAVRDFGGDAPVSAIVVGEPRLDGDNLAAAYAALWSRVADGANVLLLEPVPPAVTPLWPLPAPLAAAPADCGDDLFAPPLTDNLAAGSTAGLATLLHPALAYDLAHETQIDLYHWDGTRMLRAAAHPAPGLGYSGCHPLFSFRYGDGWVTVSTLPLLQHFQDTRARIYLMNLLKAVEMRKRPAPASPGLKWVLEQRLSAAQHTPTTALPLAAYYQGPPQSPAPLAVLAPAMTDGNAASCFHSSGTQRAGALVLVNLPAPRAVAGLDFDFGTQPDSLPAGFALETSAGDARWQAVAAPPIAPSGHLVVAWPPAPWQALRLRLTADAPDRHLTVCEVTAAVPSATAASPAAH